MPKERYKADENDPQSLDNWVDQYDLLCEPKWKIGLLGSVFFSGVICTVILVPWLADKYGRKLNVFINHVIYIVVSIIQIFATDINVLYVLLFIQGATFGGRIVVGLNYLLEFQLDGKKELFTYIRMVANSTQVIIIALVFEFVTKNWRELSWVLLALCIIATAYIVILVPESILWLHSMDLFKESREGLTSVAR